MLSNNDILRRLRYTFSFSDDDMMALFAEAGSQASRAEISNWLKKDEHEEFVQMTDVQLATFLNGLINQKRGKKEGQKQEPETYLDNNIILRKLKIALNLKDNDIIEIITLARIKISKAELSAFFRSSTHRHYRICQDQFLRNFLKGLQLKYKPNTPLENS